MKQVYQQIAHSLMAMRNCDRAQNWEWKEKHGQTILDLVREFMPSGSGIDSGTKFSFDDSEPNRLVFTFGYHHMNENGYYDGWTQHEAIVTPDLAFGFSLKITGRDRNQVKEYLHEVYSSALTEGVYEKA